MEFVSFFFVYAGLRSLQSFEHFRKFGTDGIWTREKTKYSKLWHDGFSKLSCLFYIQIKVKEVAKTNYFEQSDKITEGLRTSFRSADAKMANRLCYGYAANPNGELVINENEAAVVQWIFG